MKPSIDEVLNVIVRLLGTRKATKHAVRVEELITATNSYAGVILPSLLLLARQKHIRIKSDQIGLKVVLRNDD